MARSGPVAMVLALLVLATGAAAPAGPGVDYSRMEAELVEALNRVRSDPTGLVPDLKRRLKFFHGLRLSLPGEVTLVTNEGAGAVEEAIDFLQKAGKLPPLARSAGMSKAAAEHARELGERDATGHFSHDGDSPADRLGRHGRWKGALAENIAFGPPSGARMVLQLVVDDGVPGRQHRANFFRPEMRKIGVGCGPHPSYRTVCVIDLAVDYIEPDGSKPKP